MGALNIQPVGPPVSEPKNRIVFALEDKVTVDSNTHLVIDCCLYKWSYGTR